VTGAHNDLFVEVVKGLKEDEQVLQAPLGLAGLAEGKGPGR
jgi:hypothetical protein